MTYREVSEMIAEVGIPTAYYQFPEKTNQQPPFICFYYPSSDDFMADDTNYVDIRPLNIELYTDEKDFAMEAAVEAVLRGRELSYRKTETVIDSERMYMVAYYTEVIINE